MINQGDSIATVKTKIADALALVGVAAPTSWLDATNKINTEATSLGLDGIADGLAGGTARARINAVIVGLETPANVTPPSVSGTPTQWQTLTSTTGSWTGKPTITYSRQWFNTSGDISGATGTTYILQPSDVGLNVGVRVVATNSSGASSASSASVGPIAEWTPVELGASLLDMWDAEEAATLTLTGASVDAWASSKNSYPAVQAVGASKPTYSATSFNGRPGVTFDGLDDVLVYAAQPFPTGTSELWALLDVTTPGATVGSKYAFSYGGADNSSARALRRGSTAGINRASAVSNAAPTADHPTNAAGRHVWRGVFTSGVGWRIEIDGVPGALTAGTPTAGTTRVVLGALQTGVSTFFQGVSSAFAVTAPLTDDQASAFTFYLKSRGGIS